MSLNFVGFDSFKYVLCLYFFSFLPYFKYGSSSHNNGLIHAVFRVKPLVPAPFVNLADGEMCDDRQLLQFSFIPVWIL